MLYQRIRDLREDNDKTQKDIAEYLGLNTEVYARYERGHRMMPLDLMSKLADYYDVSIDYIVERTNKKKTNK